VTEPKYKRLADDVEELYWDHTTKEIQQKLDMGGSTYTRAKEYAGLPQKTKANKVAYEHGVGLERLLSHLHHDASMSVNKMSDALCISRSAIYTGFEKIDVAVRGQAEAERVKNENMSEDERREQTQAARDEHFTRYGDGGYISQWVKENADKHSQIAQKAAPLGTPVRDENGMTGRTGQDHPCWRGGKSVYDAVKKQLPGKSWRKKKVEAKKRDDNACQMCDATGCKLDSHHIVPVMAGGTNGFWNLITLCESCHRTVEMWTHGLTGMDAVLTE
jgi:hypothetical protein